MAAAATVGLAISLAACSQFISHEAPGMYSAVEEGAGGDFTDSLQTSDPKPYQGSRVAKVALGADPTSATRARGVVNMSGSSDYGFYGAALYFPPGTLNGPDPKQQRDLDVVRWDYGNEAEFGGLRIGADHKVRLIRGQTEQAVETIGDSFSFQEGCWNWVVVEQKLSSDAQQRINKVHLNGVQLFSSSDPNWYGHFAQKVRFGAVSVGEGAQAPLDFYLDQSFVSNYPLPDPIDKACDPIFGGAEPSTISMSAQTPVSDATSFLYSGDFPIQHGVSASTIEEKRGAVIEGKVDDPQGDPLEGVRVMVVGHPEFGYTETHSDGKYYMAVNGGGELRVRFEKEDYAPVDRQLEVPWQEYSAVDDVVMTPLDQKTDIDLSQSSTAFLVARGSNVSDTDGDRKATLFFQQGTTATMKMPDGSSQPLTNLGVRATELTVGASGPEAMPAELPPASGYTYAADFTVDRALSDGASSVDFGAHPVISYTDNFLSMPTGETVPAGYYDSQKGAWVPSESGKVIKILSNDGGIAHLSVASDDHEASASELAAPGLEITDAERQQLAETYPNIPTGGKSLWRVRITHFSNWDYNWNQKPANDVPPGPLGPLGNTQDNGCRQSGSSTIGCEDQVLGEHLDITGSKFGMSYRSDRSSAHKASYEIKVPLTDANPPSGLQHVEVRVNVAGQDLSPTSPFSGAANQTYAVPWDGKDAFGRTLQGEQPADVSIGYSYAGQYYRGDLFADYGNGSIISASHSRDEVTFWRSYTTRVGAWDARGQGLGGWTLDVHHLYDPNAQTLYMGDGTRHSTGDINQVISTVAGGGTSSSENVDATQAELNSVTGLAVAPDGSYYISDFYHDRVRRVGTDGKIQTVVGTYDWNQAWHAGNCAPDPPNDGVLAVNADVNGPEGLDVGPDGSLYIADRLCNRIRRISPDGHLYTVAGISEPHDVAVADDGTVYASGEFIFGRVNASFGVDPISQELPNNIIKYHGVDIGPDGAVYFIHGALVQRLNPDGTISKVAGGSDTGDYGAGEDGGPAIGTKLNSTGDIGVLPDGSFYIADDGSHRLRYVNSQGIITRVAGKPLTAQGTPQSGFIGDDGPARASALNAPRAVAVGPTGVYVGDYSNLRVRFIQAPLPRFSGENVQIPSDDGAELYEFDKYGRHLRTVNALTGGTLYTFTYNGGGLQSIQDGDGNTTSIRPQTSPNDIVAPFGQHTTLGFTSSGLLASVTNPKNDQVQLGYSPDCTNAPDGLLSSFTDPRSHTSTYCYDGSGRLVKANDRGAGYKTLSRSDLATGHEITITSNLGRANKYKVTRDVNSDLTRVVTHPSGLQSTLRSAQDGQVTETSLEGTTRALTSGPDPRFGMKSPILAKLLTSTPDGETLQIDGNRQTNYTPGDPLSLESQTDTLSVNGHTYTTAYTASTRHFVTTSPEGRTVSLDIDSQGRPAQKGVSGIQPIGIAYDNRGRLQDETTQDPTLGARNWHYTYKGGSGADAGLLDTVTDPLSRTTSFGYDAAGRVTSETLPGNRVITYGHDANGNLRSVTPPSRPAHTFSFDPVDLPQDYTPPALDTTSVWTTVYEYNDDHDLTKIIRPDGTSNPSPVTFTYDATTRRLDHFTLPGSGDTTFSYSSQTGNLSSITTPDDDQIQFAYDGSMPKRETFAGTIAASASRTYDTNLRVASSSVNDGQTVSYSYDNDGLRTGVGDITLTPDPQNGLLRTTSMASSSTGHVTSSLSYNAFGELATESAAYGQDALFSEQITQRDAVGRIRQKVETTSQGTHTYDYTYEPTTGFLDTVVKDGTATIADYGYDGNGNRQSKTSGGVTLTGSSDDQDRLQSYGGNTYTYTDAGDRKTKNDGSHLTIYGYDALGDLQHVTLDANGTPTNIDYVLDGLGRRIAKKVGGNLAEGFIYGAEALGPVAELDAQGSVRSRFVYATRPNVPDYMVRGGNTYRIITDDLGSPRTIVDTSSGQVAQELDYDEFGNVVRNTNPGFQPFAFAGGLYDSDTKLLRFGARDYDAETGTWTTRDPIRFVGGSPNLYGYALGDPVNLTDPLGLRTLGACVSGSIGFGINVSGQICGQVSTSGEIGATETIGAGPGAAGASIGIGPQGSNAKHISDLKGPFVNANVNGALGAEAGANGFAGTTDCGDTVYGGGFQVGAGIGGGESVMVTETYQQSVKIWP